MLLICGPGGNVIRWLPPLNVTQDEIDAGLRVFEAALSQFGGNPSA